MDAEQILEKATSLKGAERRLESLQKLEQDIGKSEVRRPFHAGWNGHSVIFEVPLLKGLPFLFEAIFAAQRDVERQRTELRRLVLADSDSTVSPASTSEGL